MFRPIFFTVWPDRISVMIFERPRQKNGLVERSLPLHSYLRPCALIVSAAATLAGVGTAGAVDWYTGEKTSGPDYAPNVVLDASDSLTSKNSDFGAVALTAALEGNLAQEGFRGRVEGIGGVYSYFTTLPPAAPGGVGAQQKVFACQEDAGALGGYGWVSRDWSTALYGGVQLINTTLSYNDPGNATKGLRIGAKIAGEFYGNPTKNTMVSGCLVRV